MSDDRYTGEEYTGEEHVDDDESRFYPGGWFGMGWPRSFWGDDADLDEEHRRGGAYDYPEGDDYESADAVRDEDEDAGWWDEGLIATLLVVGTILFIIPEPATSGLGILLLGAGVVAWLVDWAT